MKDYSQFFKNPESFITECNIDEENEVISTTFSRKSDNAEFIYPLEKGRLTKLHNKLTNQYQKLIENKNLFFKSKRRRVNKIRKILLSAVIALGVSTTAAIIFNLGALAIILTFLSLSSLTALICNELNAHDEVESFKVYEEYLEKTKDLEQTVPQEENILGHIKNPETLYALEKQNSLYEKGFTDNVFNTFFMDEANVEDLKRILTNLKVYQGLQANTEIDTSVYSKKKKLAKK